jgi:hypothetical protein
VTPDVGMTFRELAAHPRYSPLRPSSFITSAKAAIMLGGHFPCRDPTINRFLATSRGKLIVLAVKPEESNRVM